jgi:hypothetical protein
MFSEIVPAKQILSGANAKRERRAMGTSFGEESDDWYLSNVSECLRTLVAEKGARGAAATRSARRAASQLRKISQLGHTYFAIVGAALALMSIRTKQKQLDPCSRNYYRSDSGECVFASPHGSLFSMPGNTQKTFKHEVPKEPA